MNRFHVSWRWMMAVMLVSVGAGAEPQPGDVYREVVWRGPFVNAGNWQRVTDPAAPHEGAQAHLPNPVNHVVLDHLGDATRAEITIELWGGHAGTSGKRVRINGHDWIDIGEPAGIPGDAGSNPNPECYQYLAHPTVRIPLEQLQEGDNTFEFTAGGQTCYDFGWGQWGLYGVVFRTYYDAAKTPHSTGRFAAPVPGQVFADDLEIRMESDSESIASIDIIGRYEDFDVRGDGSWLNWQYNYEAGRLRQHIGTVAQAPWSLTWDSGWVPDQREPIQLMARVLDESGVYHLTQPVSDIRLVRPDRSVQLYKPYRVPSRWQTRARATQRNSLYIPHDTTHAVAAKMILRTWSGGHADAIGLNDVSLVERVGRPHGRSHDELDVPLTLLQVGENRAFTTAHTEEHGIEVLWPGIALKVAYSRRPPAQPPTDELILGARVSPDWIARSDSETLFQEDDSGSAPSNRGATQVVASGTAWELDLRRRLPLDVRPHRALRLAFQVTDVELVANAWLSVAINDGRDRRLAGRTATAVDLTSSDWQIVELPIDSLGLTPRYLESIQLKGKFSGRFRLADVMVLQASPTAVMGIGDAVSTVPHAVQLSNAYPNPFNASTVLDLELATTTPLQFTIFDALGRRVVRLWDRPMEAGRHSLRWDGRDAGGAPVATGVYYVRLRSGTGTQVRRLLLLK